MAWERIVLLVIDACGVGELPDAAAYGDDGAATLPHVAKAVGGLNLPHCRRLGLGNIVPIRGVPPAAQSQAAFGKMAERSQGKDSTIGHWELAGLVSPEPFPVYPNGFPQELVREFEKRAGVEAIGNEPASGTEIIARLGAEHLETGKVILYTSADSVFQLAAHEERVPPGELYRICRVARNLLQGEHGVGRVIARPFVGEQGSFRRTAGRRDFSRPPSGPTLLDAVQETGTGVKAIGKINDLFAGRGVDTAVKTPNNEAGMDEIVVTVRNDNDHALVFANLCDFDELWGHRNDPVGFAGGLEAFDRRLGELLPLLRDSDLLVITADHGCDPTLTDSTDHTREYVPLLVYAPVGLRPVALGTRQTFADVAATLAKVFGLDDSFPGVSCLHEIT